MDAQLDPEPAPPADADVILDGEEEAVDGVPVLDDGEQLMPAVPSTGALSPVGSPAVQAAAVAATGFVAGAATLALVRRRSARKLARTAVRRRAADALPILGTRSFLVDVHLIKGE